MPYNNTAIPPPEEITGTSSLPLARVKKIIATDEDIAQCSNSAAFAISIATEIFIRYLTEQAHNMAKSERKPRRNIQYKDLANAVARIDNLDFLADVIPKTTTYRQFKEKKAKEDATAQGSSTPLAPGQTALRNGHGSATASRNSDGHADGHQPMDMNGVLTTPTVPLSNGSPMADRTMHPSTHGHPSQEDDEMQD